jgi:hypothetical protein
VNQQLIHVSWSNVEGTQPVSLWQVAQFVGNCWVLIFGGMTAYYLFVKPLYVHDDSV